MSLDILAWDPKQKDYVVVQKPKLLPACQTAVTENMEVKSDSSTEVTKARSQVQELLLLNHPVDCPICDQAGECRLQDYWLEHQHNRKRMGDEIIHKPKAVSFGPTIVYDAERCVMCTCCVRFCDEIAKDPVLGDVQRGNLSEIAVAPGRALDNDYTLMTEFLCPVGALTSKDFRFKARVWFLRSAKTICTGCATGCNAFLDYDPRTQRPYRHRPRENAAVNQYWMCDEGMLSYQRLVEGRLLEPLVGGRASTFSAALASAKELFKSAPKDSVAVVLSEQHSNEDNFALYELARSHMGVNAIFVSGKADGEGDRILRNADKNPNRAGVRRIAQDARPVAQLLDGIASGKYSFILALGSEVAEAAQVLEVFERRSKSGPTAPTLVTLATHAGPLVQASAVVLPVCAWAEAEGTYFNARGMAQVSARALEPRGADVKPAWEVIARFGQALGYATTWRKLDPAFDSASADV